MSKTFAEKLSSDNEHAVFLVKGFDFTGKNSWYFVKVAKEKSAEFSAMIEDGGLADLAQHGTVIISGYGNAPPVSAYEAAKKK